MKYVSLDISVVNSPEYIGSKPVQRATWVSVLFWSVGQENSGRILGAAHWSDRQWQQTCGVTKREVTTGAPLVTIEGEDVVVWRYPLDLQLGVQTQREGGRLGGLKSAAARAGRNASNGSSSPSSYPSRVGSSSDPTKESKKESKVSGGEAAPPPPRKILGEEDIAALQAKYPRKAIRAEWAKAVKRDGPDIDVDWFEKKWLPNAPELSLARQAAVDSSDESEPDGWREVLADTKYGPGGAFEAKTWADVSAAVKDHVRKQLKGES